MQPSIRQPGSTKEYKQNTSHRSILYKYHDGYLSISLLFQNSEMEKREECHQKRMLLFIACYYAN